MTSIIPSLLEDVATTRRIARVLLKHVRPKNKEEAISILNSRLGIYMNNNSAITNEVERYFL